MSAQDRTGQTFKDDRDLSTWKTAGGVSKEHANVDWPKAITYCDQCHDIFFLQSQGPRKRNQYSDIVHLNSTFHYSVQIWDRPYPDSKIPRRASASSGINRDVMGPQNVSPSSSNAWKVGG